MIEDFTYRGACQPVNRVIPLTSTFVSTDHYRIYKTLRESTLAKHPRRTAEAFVNKYIKGKWLDDNPVIEAKTLSELHDWCRPLIEAEDCKHE